MLAPEKIQVNRVLARYTEAAGKYKNKTKDSEGNVQYEYSDKQVSHRNNAKASRIEKLRNLRSKLISQVKKDYKSPDLKTRMTALAVGLLDHTYERVGNDQSAKEGHFGVTGWQAKHIKFNGNGATLNYVGKSGVNQSKKVTDPGAVALLKELAKGKSGSDCLFEHDGVKVGASDVNAYLPEGITAKDLRGLHANEEMRSRLKAVRSKGPSLPKDRKDRDKVLKKELATALEETAKVVGHEPSTLKSQYLVPKMVDSFLHDGTVIDKLKVGTKTPFEKEQEAGEDLIKPEPTKKPPRMDLRKRKIVDDDPDLEKANATNDRDLSMNYKKIGKRDDTKLYPHVTQKGTKMVPWTSLTQEERDRYRRDRTGPSEEAPKALKPDKVAPRPGKKKLNPEEVVKKKKPPAEKGNFEKLRKDLAKRPKPKKDPEEKSDKSAPAEADKAKPSKKPDEGKKKAPAKEKPPAGKGKKKSPAKKKKVPTETPVGGLDEATKKELSKFIKQEISKAVKERAPKKRAPKKKPESEEKPATPPPAPKSETPEAPQAPEEQKDQRSEGQILGDLLDNSKVMESLPEIYKGLGDKPTPKKFQKALQEAYPEVEISPRASRTIVQNFKDGKDLADLADTARDLLGKEEATVKKQLSRENAERVQMFLDETISGSQFPTQEKRRFLNLTSEMSPEDQNTVMESMRASLENRVGDVVDSDAIQGHIRNLKDLKVPKDPAEMGKYLADRLYAQNVVFNPFMAGGTPISNYPKSETELQTRASQAYDQFRDLGPKNRDRAAAQLHAALEEIDKDSPAYKEIQALLNGVGLASTLKGQSTEGLPPPSYLLTAVARGLERKGEERTLLNSMDPNDPDFRENLISNLKEMSDEELVDIVKGDAILDTLGGQLLETQGKDRRELRQLMEDIVVDHTKNVDTMIRDAVESKGDKDRAYDQKYREKLKREISEDNKDVLRELRQKIDRKTRDEVRLNQLEATLSRLTSLFGKMKGSMARAVARKATNERDLNFLDHRTTAKVSRPKITGARLQSTSKTPKPISRYKGRRNLLKPAGKKAGQSFPYNESQMNRGNPCLRTEPYPSTGDSEMSNKKLTKQGALQITQDLDKLAHTIQHNYQALGIENVKIAEDFALRCDMISDAIDKKAFTEAPMTIKDDEGAKVPGGLTEDNTNMDMPKQKFDPADIGKVKAPERQEADEPYMDAFTQDEFHQLENVQSKGQFSNAKAAKLAEAIMEAIA